MKKTTTLLVAAAAALFSGTASAADLQVSSTTNSYTQPDSSTIPWNSSDTYWYNGSANVAWTDNNTVVFSGSNSSSSRSFLELAIDPTVTGFSVTGQSLMLSNNSGADRTITVNGDINVATSRTLTLQGANASNEVILTGTYIITNLGTISMASNSVVTGAMEVKSGSFSSGSGAVTNLNLTMSGAGTVTHNNGNGMGLASLSGTNPNSLIVSAPNSGTPRALQLTQTSSTTYAGKLKGGNTNNTSTLQLNKYGTGTLTLTGDNSDMARSNNATTLTVSNGVVIGGSANALGGGSPYSFTNTVVVQALGTLGVNNTANVLVGNLSLSNGAKFVFDLTGASSFTDTQLLVSGAWTGSGNYTIDLLGTSGLAAGTYTLLNSISTIGASGFTKGTGWGENNLSNDSNNIYLEVVPEPTTVAMLGLSGLALAAYRLRRRNR